MNIGVMFGSRSVEHDVSITSAYGVIKGLEKMGKYKVYPIYVTRTGLWIYDPKFSDINSFKDFHEEKYKNSQVSVIINNKKKLIIEQKSGGIFSGNTQIAIDFVFPIFHGMNGEDGAIHGMLDMLQVPYMGPSVSGNALGMNKIIMKNMFKSLGLPITKYLVYKHGEENMDEIESSIPYPLIVKPANLGSSIGISKVANREDLKNSLEVAFHYDQHVIVEECVQNLCELNCSVSEKNNEVITSHVEQPIASSDFLSFEEKYISSDGGTMQGLKNKVKIPADIPEELSQTIKSYSKIIYSEFFCKGGAPRIDYLYDTGAQKLYVNEINTIPGALQMHLWARSGMEVGDFLQNLIDVGIQKAKEREINIDFQSNIIGHTINFVK